MIMSGAIAHALPVIQMRRISLGHTRSQPAIKTVMWDRNSLFFIKREFLLNDFKILFAL